MVSKIQQQVDDRLHKNCKELLYIATHDKNEEDKNYSVSFPRIYPLSNNDDKTQKKSTWLSYKLLLCFVLMCVFVVIIVLAVYGGNDDDNDSKKMIVSSADEQENTQFHSVNYDQSTKQCFVDAFLFDVNEDQIKVEQKETNSYIELGHSTTFQCTDRYIHNTFVYKCTLEGLVPHNDNNRIQCHEKKCAYANVIFPRFTIPNRVSTGIHFYEQGEKITTNCTYGKINDAAIVRTAQCKTTGLGGVAFEWDEFLCPENDVPTCTGEISTQKLNHDNSNFCNVNKNSINQKETCVEKAVLCNAKAFTLDNSLSCISAYGINKNANIYDDAFAVNCVWNSETEECNFPISQDDIKLCKTT